MRRIHRRRTRGQAMVELAILVPLLVFLFLGSWTATALVGDNDTALQASQVGARYGAELGGALPSGATIGTFCTNHSADPPTCQVDVDIIDEMLPVFSTNMPNAVVNYIDIYQPDGSGNGCTFATGTCPPPQDGAFVTGDYAWVDTYPISGTSIGAPTSLTYGLGKRDTIQPDESELGVAIQFAYTSPTWSLFTIATDTQYSVERLEA
ncbi:MAG: TadE/TadG family type IV pilus assembly protein [Candidatus Dormibacteria bacterium]|jgi:Flp pilus assembly protein TadG